MPLCFKSFIKLNNTLMPQSQQYSDLMHNFRFLFLICHEFFVDTFQRNKFSCHFMHTQTNFSKGAATKHFTCSVEMSGGFWCIFFFLERLFNQIRQFNNLFRPWRQLALPSNFLIENQISDLFNWFFAYRKCLLRNTM